MSIHCLNPTCPKPINPDDGKFCQGCGRQLRLRGRYCPLQPLGQGGFGRTFLALDLDVPSRPPCVIKQFAFSEQNRAAWQKAIALFRQEAVRLDELGGHPQIPKLMAYFEQDQRLYLVQEFVAGPTLLEELAAEGAFGEEKIWAVLQDMLPVLQFIHERSIIHRDIKPQNVLRRNSDGRLVLIDFGVAKLVSETGLHQVGTVIGSPEYMAPEQLRGQSFPASDLYCLGVMCAHLLTQVPPLQMMDLESDRWVWRDFLLPERRVSRRLGQVLDKLLQGAVSQRYPSAAAVLEAIAQTPPVMTSSLPPSPPLPPVKTAGLSLAPLPTSAPLPQRLVQWFARAAPSRRQFPPLISEAGVDYGRLVQLLYGGRWQAADEETWQLLCQSLGQSKTYLMAEDVSRLPCEDLQMMDALWREASGDRFGWSIQVQIYRQAGEDYGNFCRCVGWPAHQGSLALFQFQRSAPRGHLPSRQWVGGLNWWRHMAWVSDRWTACGLG